MLGHRIDVHQKHHATKPRSIGAIIATAMTIQQEHNNEGNVYHADNPPEYQYCLWYRYEI
jgi:hypothetical protein